MKIQIPREPRQHRLIKILNAWNAVGRKPVLRLKPSLSLRSHLFAVIVTAVDRCVDDDNAPAPAQAAARLPKCVAIVGGIVKRRIKNHHIELLAGKRQAVKFRLKRRKLLLQFAK